MIYIPSLYVKKVKYVVKSEGELLDLFFAEF